MKIEIYPVGIGVGRKFFLVIKNTFCKTKRDERNKKNDKQIYDGTVTPAFYGHKLIA
jgi:hypothetical protein